MKIEIIQKKEKPHFEPITIEITIDNVEDYYMLLHIAAYNVAIPSLLDGHEKASSYRFLSTLHTTLKNIKYQVNS